MTGRQRFGLMLGLAATGIAFFGGAEPAGVVHAAGPPPSALAPTPGPTPPPAPATIELKDTPFEGGAKAPIKVVVYSDFLCPHCRSVAHALGRYVETSPDRVAIYYKFYPLDATCNPGAAVHAGACWLAFGGVCAQEQGQFWPYHDKVFTLEHRPPAVAPNRPVVESLAAALKLDEAAFRGCLDSPRPRAHITADIQEGSQLGVRGTPAIFINGRRLGQPSEFMTAVDEEAKRLGLPAAAAAAK